jgi:hypothetical protein
MCKNEMAMVKVEPLRIRWPIVVRHECLECRRKWLKIWFIRTEID